MKVVVIIDVFRAFTTASYVLDKRPSFYALTEKQMVISRLAEECLRPIIIGKPEKGMDGRLYDIPNSPSRVLEVDIAEKNIIHRTAAGARGVLQAFDADIVLAAAFVNAAATANYIKGLSEPTVTLVPMGHEGETPSLEDNLCAECINALIQGKSFELAPHIPFLREGAGRYFFSEDQWQYPKEDFDRCLDVDRFNFVIRAEVKEDYALLFRC